MGLFSLFSAKQNAPIHKVKVDMHSHLLPGIDDGSKTIDHTIGMLRKFEELGYKKLILTPHVMSGVYNNTSEIILGKLEEVRQAIKELGLKITVEASAEYYLDETFIEKVKTKDLLPFNGNQILFECSFRDEPRFLEQAVFELQTKGYQPVLAHLERYIYYHGSIEKAKQLRTQGVFIQVNLNSFAGHYGPQVQKQAELLLKHRLIDYVGSDCHRIEHLQILENNLSKKSFHQLFELPLKNFEL